MPAISRRGSLRIIDGDRVRYVGPVDDAQKNQLLGEAAALLMPIGWEEPFGIVMAEACACGTPVIAFARGSVPEVVRDGVNGFACGSVDEAIARGRLARPARSSGRARRLRSPVCRIRHRRRLRIAVPGAHRPRRLGQRGAGVRLMRRVLMISPHFPPDSTAATHRVRLLAPHMAGHGWEPTVLTVDPRDYEGRLDPGAVRQRAAELADRADAGVAGAGEPRRRRRRSRHSRVPGAVARRVRSAVAASNSTPCSSRSTRPIRRCSVRFSNGASRLPSCSTIRIRGSGSGAAPPGRASTAVRISRAGRAGSSRRAWSRTRSEPPTPSPPFHRATYEQALERTPEAKPRASAELPIGWDRRDLEFVDQWPPPRRHVSQRRRRARASVVRRDAAAHRVRHAAGGLGRCCGAAREQPRRRRGCGCTSSARATSGPRTRRPACCRSRRSTGCSTS